MVDENGVAVILKNNKSRYVLIEYSQLEKDEIVDDIEVGDADKNILSKHIKSFEKLEE